MYVPDSMKHSYRGLLKEERNRLKKQAKQQQKKRMTARMTVDKSVAKSGKKNIVDQVMHEFLQQDHLKRYRLSNLSYHGRRMVVPKLAKMFNLDISPVKSSKSCIDLVKTKKTCKPAVPKKSRAQNSITKHQSSSRMEKIQSRQDEKHGKQVASSSTPISTNNVGHRMLAAMGWKEGEAIGNSQKGIKEPIKVFMRANRRGLGA
ncbi:G-patch domain-containing protein [Parasitella parasitica]|nr:G-patch domain-containing protein [Parasitella parasitica]